MFTGFAARLGLGEPSDHSELRKTLRVLLTLDRATRDWAVNYVLKGSEPQNLAAWSRSQNHDPYIFLGTPGGRPNPWSPDRKTNDALIAKAIPGWSIDHALAERDRLYANIASLTAEQVVRFGRLLVAFQRDPDFIPPSAVLPDWLALLELDAFSTIVSQTRTDTSLKRNLWTPARVLSWLASEDISGDEAHRIALSFYFDRQGLGTTYYYTSEPLKGLYLIPELATYAGDHAALLETLVPKFSLHARTAFIGYVAAHPEIQQSLLPLVAALSVDASKAVRAEAIATLSTIDQAAQVSLFEPVLAAASASRVPDLVNVLGRIDGGLGRLALQRVLDGGPSPKTSELIRTALDRGDVLASPVEKPPIDVPPFEPLAEAPVDTGFVPALRASIDARVVSYQRANAELKAEKDQTYTAYRIEQIKKNIASLKQISDNDLRDIAAYLSGTRPARPAKIDEVNSMVAEFPLTLLQRIRISTINDSLRWWDVSKHHDLDVDLRILADALARSGHSQPDREIAKYVFRQYHFDVATAEHGLVWPFFVEHPESLEEALGMRPQSGENYWDTFEADRALDLVELLPVIPHAMIARISEIALGVGKTNRLAAQLVMERHSNALALATQGLANPKLETRDTAAKWISRLRDPAAAPALRTALAKEKGETVKAAILAALESLGEDVSDYLSPDALTADAVRNLKTARPAALSWFPFERLPELRWASTGSVVQAEVAQWWLILATKLKEPGADGLIGRYVSLLDAASQATLGEFILRSWVAEDTAHPPDEESRDHANAAAPTQLVEFHKLAKDYPQYYAEYAAYTLDQVYEILRRDHAARYIGSALPAKGVLALTAGTPGHIVVKIVQSFMRDNYLRRHQVEALIAAVSANDDPAAMQLLLSVARRHRTASVQERARLLVDQLAERKGWTPEELADRTIPTAHFDDDGVLRLSFGEREFTGRLTPAFTLELSSSAGKVIKSLPAAREVEDADLVKETKATLTSSRAELKQVVAIQTQRLYEAMCVERTWPVADWTEFLLGHPIVSRLMASLVWIENPGESQRLFRASDDGALIDATDEDITLADDAVVMLAHSSLVSADDAEAWRTHLADYALTPLFDQFGGASPVVAEGATTIEDRKGWLTDSFSVRGAATKLGYQRGSSEDGGWFSEYTKDFTSVGLRVVISFTGNTLPEENIPASITSLEFVTLGRRAGKPLVLTGVPRVLLAAAYGDYLRIADSGSFDPQWEKKSEW